MYITSPLIFALPFIFPAIFLAGLHLGGLFHYTLLIAAYFLIPVFDYMVSRNKYNLTSDQEATVKENRAFKYAIWAFVPVLTGCILYSIYFIVNNPLMWWESPGAVLSIAVLSGGLGITVAHELSHKNNPFERNLARAMLVHTFYMHFVVEHVRGHHLKVSTPEDPATSRFNQNVYDFAWKSVVYGFLSAINLEAKRLNRAGKSAWHYSNEVIWSIVCPVIVCAFVAYFFGWVGLIYYVAQGVIGFLYLEIINYVEHYGLERKKISSRNGVNRYEKVAPHHSWNSDHRVSNILLYHLPRHSDHHAFASRDYQVLRTRDDLPQLPYGYPTMVMIAIFPPLWKKIMNPLVMKHRAHKPVRQDRFSFDRVSEVSG